MLTRGKMAILAMVVLAVMLGGFSWWHHYWQGRRCRQLWGVEALLLIRYAPRVPGPGEAT